MELHEALSHIAEIRAKVAATEQFRGYRALPIALTGVGAVVAALLQPMLLPQPAENLPGYLVLWFSVAFFGLIAAGAGIWLRHRHGANRLSRELTLLAVGQFAPCLIAGGLVTIVIIRFAPNLAPVLPGLWQVLFSLGHFASYRLLPRAILLSALFYLAAGVYNLTLVNGPDALSPWVMGLPFGGGQLLTAAVLYWSLERRNHGDEA
jgi:hypothetical protein